MPGSQRWTIAVVSLILTWLFCIEYIPPFKQVRLWSDIEGFHYPLLNFAHKAVRHGRVPLWDHTIYSGITFAGNVQAGMFYPPNWLLFAAHAGRDGLRFTSIEILAFLHLWLAFLFSFLWLRERSAYWIPPALGGMTVACGGYLLSQMNHLGVACGYAWIPFGLWGIEQASRRRDWRPLWKLSVAAAMCFLAGYPPTAVVFGIIAITYALALPWHAKLFPMAVAALLLSGALAAVQLLPAYEAARLKTPEETYGSEPPFGNRLSAALLLPNYFDQNRTMVEGIEISEADYLYLGAPLFFGFAWLLRRRWFDGAGPALAIGGVIVYLITDPGGLVLRAIPHVPLAGELLRRHNLIAGLPIASALLVAAAVSDFLSRQSKLAGPRETTVWMATAMLWSGILLFGPQFASGAPSIVYPAILLFLITCGLWLYRGRPSHALAAILILIVWTDYRAFGINRRFNAITENADDRWRGDARLGGNSFAGLEDSVFQELLRNPGYRIALHEGPHATDMRHYGLATPQGFDPLLTDRYKAAVEAFQPFKTNRLFDIDPLNEPMLRHFGVRWVLVRQQGPMEATLLRHPAFRRLPGNSYFSVFEHLNPSPAWRFPGSVQMTEWQPELRRFRVHSDAGGRFVLVEQFFPGWKVTMDGQDAENTLADAAFQSVAVPGGDHTVEFRYSPASLHTGAIISLLGIVLVVLAARRAR